MGHHTSSTAGFTIIEMVLTLAVLGILMGVGAMNLRPPAVRTASNSVQSFVQQARFEAIKTNRPVVVEIGVDGLTLTAARTTGANVVNCSTAGAAYRTLDLTTYRGVRASSAGLPLVWLPTGLPRACPAGASPLAVSGVDVVLSGTGTSATVRVGAGGEVAVR
ncbi:MAG TPA: GspH/FimT family pseudopilin [Trueperaceae bacterium]|nr:GspH/FimT family pseudopilin [Trueperaceae bacterium]